MTDRNVRYAHIRKNRNTSIGGGMTVAFYQDGLHVKFAISSCAPKVNFCKKIGRERALEALTRGELCTVSISAVKAMKDWKEIKYPKDVIYALFA